MAKRRWFGLLVVAFFAVTAFAAEMTPTSIDKFGYSLKIPEGFALQGDIDNTTTWMRHKASGTTAAKPAEEAPKKKGFGSKLKAAVGAKGDEAAPAAESGGGGGEAALTIYVNWVYMPDVSSKQMFDINKKSMQDKISGPNPDYTELKELKLKDGYGFWYKEVDKKDGAEIHRWHINAYGNKSAYTIGLTGTFGQFAEWGKVYEEVINSFAFVPLKG